MVLLDAINLILRKLEEHAVTSVNSTYSTVSFIKPKIEQNKERLLMEGFWFNKYRMTLPADILGEVVTPADTLAFYPDSTDYTWDGQYITTEEGSRTINESVPGWVILDRDFDTLPSAAQYAITFAACAEIYADEAGVDDVYTGIKEDETEARVELGTQQVKQLQRTARQRRSFNKWRLALRS